MSRRGAASCVGALREEHFAARSRAPRQPGKAPRAPSRDCYLQLARRPVPTSIREPLGRASGKDFAPPDRRTLRVPRLEPGDTLQLRHKALLPDAGRPEGRPRAPLVVALVPPAAGRAASQALGAARAQAEVAGEWCELTLPAGEETYLLQVYEAPQHASRAPPLVEARVEARLRPPVVADCRVDGGVLWLALEPAPRTRDAGVVRPGPGAYEAELDAQGVVRFAPVLPGDEALGVKLPAATRCRVRIRRRHGPWSLPCEALAPPGPPNAVVRLSAQPVRGGAVLRWEPGHDGGSPVTEYAAGCVSCGLVATSKTSCLLVLPDDPDHEHCFEVVARNRHGASKPRSCRLRSVAGPSALRCARADTHARWEWDPYPAALYYEVAVAEAGERGPVSAVHGTKHTSEGLRPGAEYELRARAVLATGRTAWTICCSSARGPSLSTRAPSSSGSPGLSTVSSPRWDASPRSPADSSPSPRAWPAAHREPGAARGATALRRELFPREAREHPSRLSLSLVRGSPF